MEKKYLTIECLSVIMITVRKRKELAKMKKEICFDMDGTIADLYGVEGWLEDLEHFSTPHSPLRGAINDRNLYERRGQ